MNEITMNRNRQFATILIELLLVGVIGMGVTSAAIASGDAVQAVEFSKLIEFLPDAPSGWDDEEPTGMTFTHEGGTWSMATESYSKTDAEDMACDIVITDYAFYTAGWSAAWQGFYAYDYTEGYAKTVRVEGLPAWEVYTKDGNDYALSVAINDRFLVVITTNSDKDTLYDFANSIDYNGIAVLDEETRSPAETVQPTLTPTPKPTLSPEPSPEEPGFEAIFALAGLLAVAYLVSRRI
jgi:PGF-CTERM protein